MKDLIFLAVLKFAIAVPTGHSLNTPVTNGLPFYFPKNQVQSFAFDKSVSGFNSTVTKEVAKTKLAEQLGLQSEEIEITWSSTNGELSHFYANRLVNGMRVQNNQASIHFKGGQVIGQSSSFTAKSVKFSKRQAIPDTPKITAEEAIKLAEDEYSIPRTSLAPKQVYVETTSGNVALAHQFTLRDDAQSKWFLVNVDATNGEILSTVNYYRSATFRAIELPNLDPTAGFADIVNPENAVASPEGWNAGSQSTGNNVQSLIGGAEVNGNIVQGQLTFDTRFSANQEPTVAANQQTAVVNTFYISNMVHDITYGFGFDEANGNFQTDNFGKGGRGGDAVVVNNQAPGANNANFATPPDGETPTMNMFLFTLSNPNRDGSLDNIIPIHEYFHGISNRLTGGPAQADCLNTLESAGMGEGWSDIGGFLLTMKETDKRDKVLPLATFAINSNRGIRIAPYSTDLQVNSLTFQDAANFQVVHDIGTVWATMLYEVYFNLVDEFGFSSNWFDATQKRGNIITMRLLLEGMKLQPCNPSFIEARDAIIQADQNIFNGEMRCFLMAGFAKRGLGVNARDGFVNGFNNFPGC